jgi:hypothetical protein
MQRSGFLASPGFPLMSCGVMAMFELANKR